MSNASGDPGVGVIELRAAKGWLIFLTLFEVPEIYKYLVQDAPFSGFFSTLTNKRPEKRLWYVCVLELVLVLVLVRVLVCDVCERVCV